MLDEMLPGGMFLETGPVLIAMVIRVKFSPSSPAMTIQICTAWLLMHDYVTGGICLAGACGLIARL